MCSFKKRLTLKRGLYSENSFLLESFPSKKVDSDFQFSVLFRWSVAFTLIAHNEPLITQAMAICSLVRWTIHHRGRLKFLCGAILLI